jgi:predicted ATPase
MENRLIELNVENFRSLRKISVPLGPLNVLVGPNGAGKTNLLEVFRFLADVIRTDLVPALNLRGGFDELVFWGSEKTPASFQIKLKATWTTNSSIKAPDEYTLRVGRRGASRTLAGGQRTYAVPHRDAFASAGRPPQARRTGGV